MKSQVLMKSDENSVMKFVKERIAFYGRYRS
jgi:hypothetical protein